MPIKTTTEKLEDKIVSLFFKAETLLEWSKEIRSFLDYCRSRKINTINNDLLKYLIIQQYLYFSEVVLTIHTLLKSNLVKNRNPEFCLERLIPKDKNEMENYLDIIKAKYKSSNLGGTRDKVLAHKEEGHISEPVAYFMIPIDNKKFNDAVEITNDIKKFLEKYVVIPRQNSYELLFTEGNKQVLKIIKDEIKRIYAQKKVKN